MAMNKIDLLWHQDDEFEVLSDKDGWKLMFVMNHKKNEFRYEVKQPNGDRIPGFYLNAYDALDAYRVWKTYRKKTKATNCTTINTSYDDVKVEFEDEEE